MVISVVVVALSLFSSRHAVPLPAHHYLTFGSHQEGAAPHDHWL
mgnify:CR=1 FL=1